MSSDLTLHLEPRPAGHKGLNTARLHGMVPGILHDAHGVTTPVQIPLRLLQSALLKGAEHHPFTLTIGDDENGRLAVIKSIQRDTLTSIPTHVDFMMTSAGETITVDVPVRIHGEPHLTARGLALHTQLHSLHIEGPAIRLPEAIDLFVETLHVGDMMLVSGIKVPPGVRIHSNANQIVYTVGHARKRTEPESEATPAVVGTAAAPTETKPSE